MEGIRQKRTGIISRYKRFIRFAMFSISCSLVDLFLFTVFSRLLAFMKISALFLATVFARICSATLNFRLNRRFNFMSNLPVGRQLERFYIWIICQMCLSGLFVTLLSWLPAPTVVIKIAVDVTLFFVNYFVQKNWVFRKKQK